MLVKTSTSAGDIAELTAGDGAALVRAGELKPSEWMDACLAVARAVEPELQAWAYLDHDRAMAAAGALDRVDWSKQRVPPLLAGVPLGVKDIFNSIDMPTQRGSAFWSGYMAGNDARVVARAKWAGAVVMGKTATAEFAVHTPPRTVNPCSGEHIAGTSSTGSAVAVLAGMTPLALGTQSAGSIIRPASYVGVLGYKPSFGLIPRTGVLKTGDTLDSIGWFARSVSDLELALDALRVEGRDHPNVERGIAAAVAKRGNAKTWRVALALPPAWEIAAGYARAAIEEYANQVGNRPDIDVSTLDLREELREAHDVHRIVYHKSLSHYFHDEAQKWDLLSQSFRDLLEEGRRISRDEYASALDRQAALAHRLEARLEGVDALMTLSVAGEAPTMAQPAEPRDSALVWTMCGAPSISLPMFKGPTGMPFGLQLVAPRYGDYTLLQLAKTLFDEPLPRWRPEA